MSKHTTHIILITIDCWRSDRITHAQDVGCSMPTLERLRKESTLFPVTVTAADSTDPSHASILTSTYPPVHGLMQNGVPLGSAIPTIAEVFSAADYRTMAAVGVEHLSSHFGFSRGFEDYFNSSRWDGLFHRSSRASLFGFPVRRVLGWIRSRFPRLNTHCRDAVGTTECVLPWIQRHAIENFLIWIHYFDSHNYQSESEYNAKLRIVDQQIGRIVQMVEEQKIFDDTLIAITGDHGEAFGEHGYHRHSNAALYDEEIVVPLLICCPGFPTAKEIPTQVRTIDVAPTLAELATLDIPPSWQGESLVPLVQGQGSLEDRPALCYSNPVRLLSTARETTRDGYVKAKCLRDSGWKFCHINHGEDRLTNIKEDPRETLNLHDGEVEQVKEMKARFFDLEAITLTPGPDDNKPLHDLLRDLGYLD